MADNEFIELYNKLTPEAQSGVRMAVTLLAAANSKSVEVPEEKTFRKEVDETKKLLPLLSKEGLERFSDALQIFNEMREELSKTVEQTQHHAAC